MIRFTNIKLLFCLSLFALFLASCGQDEPTTPTEETYLGKKSNEYDSKIAINWYNHTLELIKTTSGYSPPVASRALGYIGVTFYESVRPGNNNYYTLSGQLTALGALPTPERGKEYHWAAAANAALAKINKSLFPTPQAKKTLVDSILIIKEFYKDEYLKAGASTETIERSEKFGEAIAEAIFNWSKTDVIGHEGYLKNFPAAYQTPEGAGKWEPTGANLIPLQPYWGTARAFVPGALSLATPPAPIPFSTDKTSSFYSQANQVYTKSKNISTDERTIALYWADGAGTITPPGHSISIASQLIEERSESLDKAAEAFMRVGIGVADAFICCWKSKYVYNLQRPVTYIQKNIDPTWKPLIATPPFPEYTSGHASQSGVAAYVLSALYGKNTIIIDKTHIKRKDIDGSPREFANFMVMAEEAAASRLYGGIHYPIGNNEGLSSGLKIGKAHDILKIKK
jgi:hypothetical protein